MGNSEFGKKNAQRLSALDQAISTLNDTIPPTVASYYRRLTDEGVPAELASNLARDFHHLILEKSMSK